jgi:hypothetical protein
MLVILAAVAYAITACVYGEHLDRLDPGHEERHHLPAMFWIFMLVAGLAERPVQLLLPPPGEDTP